MPELNPQPFTADPPPAIQAVRRDLTTRVNDATCAAWPAGQQHWVVELADECSTLRMVYTRDPRRCWAMDPGLMRIFVKGVDRTFEAAGNLERAVELMMAGKATGGDVPTTTSPRR